MSLLIIIALAYYLMTIWSFHLIILRSFQLTGLLLYILSGRQQLDEKTGRETEAYCVHSCIVIGFDSVGTRLICRVAL